MELLKTLGINSTIVIQFFIFIVAYLILTRMVFMPYFKAYMERYNRTVGSEGDAGKLIQEAEELELEYEENAKALNIKIKNIYDTEKKVATDEQFKIIKTANLKAEEYRKSSELKLEENKSKIYAELEQEVSPIANMIKDSVIGKGAV